MLVAPLECYQSGVPQHVTGNRLILGEIDVNAIPISSVVDFVSPASPPSEPIGKPVLAD